jgi:hypothetical protein
MSHYEPTSFLRHQGTEPRTFRVQFSDQAAPHEVVAKCARAAVDIAFSKRRDELGPDAVMSFVLLPMELEAAQYTISHSARGGRAVRVDAAVTVVGVYT